MLLHYLYVLHQGPVGVKYNWLTSNETKRTKGGVSYKNFRWTVGNPNMQLSYLLSVCIKSDGVYMLHHTMFWWMAMEGRVVTTLRRPFSSCNTRYFRTSAANKIEWSEHSLRTVCNMKVQGGRLVLPLNILQPKQSPLQVLKNYKTHNRERERERVIKLWTWSK